MIKKRIGGGGGLPPPGGKRRGAERHDPVRFRSRQYSLDGRRWWYNYFCDNDV